MSLRARLLLGMAAVAVVLVVAMVATTRSMQTNLIDQVDKQLERAEPQLRPDGRPDRDGAGDQQQGPTNGVRRPPSALYVAVVDPSSGVLATLYVPGTTEADASEPDISGEDVLDKVGDAPFTVGTEGSSLRYRAVVRTEDRNGVTLFYALPLEDIDETMERLLAIQAVASVAILIALGLVTFWVLRLGVRPVREMTETAAAIGEGDLSRRIPESAPGTEAGALGVALNHMLGRIEEAFDERSRSEDRLRRFVADASHELRTPITTIRGYAELYRMGGLSEDEALREAMRRTEQEASRMGSLVGDLLELARLDQGRPIEQAPVDLAVLATDAVADARAVQPDRTISLSASDPGIVTGDEAHLRQVVANLLANARVHTPVDAPIHVAVQHEPDRVVLTVADQGPGMDPDTAAHAFERFYRADPSRARDRGGSGLGLSIVAAIVEAHGGHVALESALGRGTTVRVELPSAGMHPS